MPSIPPLANLLAFEAVARRRSFAAAAAELHLSASAISHQVARLEAHLKVRLFERSAHGVRMSMAGEQYLPRVAGALSAIANATEDLREGARTSLYVHSAPSFASLWLMPRLRRFSQACPDISLNLSAAHTHSDFDLGQADVDIRYGIPQWGDLLVEPLFEEHIAPLASPLFIQERGLRRVEQLLEVPLIQSNVSLMQWSDWFTAFSQHRAPERYPVRFDRAQMALDAATQGLGVALESTLIASQHLAEGKLKPIFGLDKALRIKAHFLVYPARHAKRPNVEAFLAWIHGEASRQPAARKAGATKPASGRRRKPSAS